MLKVSTFKQSDKIKITIKQNQEGKILHAEIQRSESHAKNMLDKEELVILEF